MKPYKILWITIPLVLLSLLLGSKGAFDLQLHDTYIVFATYQIAFFFSPLLGILGLIYYFLREYRLSTLMSTAHSWITALSVITILILATIQTFSRGNLDIFSALNKVAIIAILILVSIQFVFLINVVMGLIKGRS